MSNDSKNPGTDLNEPDVIDGVPVEIVEVAVHVSPGVLTVLSSDTP